METNSGSNFAAALVHELLENVNHHYGTDNWDSGRFGPYPSSRVETFIAYLNRLLARIGMRLIHHMDRGNFLSYLANMENIMEGLSSTYSHMEDHDSRSILIDILVYRLLGYRRMKLPLSRGGHWSRKRALAHSLIKEGKMTR